MNRFLKKGKGIVFMFAVLVIALVACGTPVEVPAAHIGKKMTDGGLQDGIIQPSKFKLESWCRSCDTLVLAQTSDYKTDENLKVFMPEDNLNLQVQVSGTYSVSASEDNVERIFSRMLPQPTENGKVSLIKVEDVYRTYAKQVVETETRNVLTQYSIEHVMNNRDAVSQEITQAITNELKVAPITPLILALADIQPPDIIVEAQEAAKQRKIDIEKTLAQKQIDITKANAALEVAEAVQAADLVEAETQVLVNAKLAESVSDAFVTQRYLKFLQTVAENDSKTLILPWEAMETVAGQNKIFSFDAQE